MKAPPFTLHRPATVDSAVGLLAELADEGALVLAGGQSLVPMMALRLAYPPDLIDINGIAGLDRIELSGDHLVIGALARHHDFRRAIAPGPFGALLARISHEIAHYPIRTRGTFCGSLAHADPASEWCLTAATLGAEMVLRSQAGERAVPVSEWFEGAMATVREPEELLVEVRLSRPAEGSAWGFYEFNRRAGDFAIGAALAGYRLEDGAMRDVRVGIGAIEEVPRRLAEVEAALEGQPPGPDAFRAAAGIAAGVVEPLEDFATPADYRRDLAVTAIERALAEAAPAQPGQRGMAA